MESFTTLECKKIIKDYFYRKYNYNLFEEYKFYRVCSNFKYCTKTPDLCFFLEYRDYLIESLSIEIKISKTDLIYSSSGKFFFAAKNFLAVPNWLTSEAKKYLIKYYPYVGILEVDLDNNSVKRVKEPEWVETSLKTANSYFDYLLEDDIINLSNVAENNVDEYLSVINSDNNLFDFFEYDGIKSTVLNSNYYQYMRLKMAVENSHMSNFEHTLKKTKMLIS